MIGLKLGLRIDSRIELEMNIEKTGSSPSAELSVFSVF